MYFPFGRMGLTNVAAMGGGIASTPDGAEEAVIEPAVMTERATYVVTKVGVIAERPSQMLAGNGLYWSHAVKAPCAAYPDRIFLYTTTDHDSEDNGSDGSGGVYLFVCVDDPTDPDDWVDYETAVSSGWLDDIPSKPEANPIYIGADGAGNQTETTCVLRVGSTWVMTYQSLGVPGARNQATIRATSSDGVNWSGPHEPLFQVSTEDAIGDGHQGYFRWGPNPFPDVPYDYVGYSLVGGQSRSTGGQWGSDDPVAGGWTFLGALSKACGRVTPNGPNSSTANPRAFSFTNIDPKSFRTTRQGVSAIAEARVRGSGSSAAAGDLYEILLSSNGRDIIGKPQPVVLRGASGYDQGEAATGSLMTFGDSRIVFYDAATSGNEKTTAIATGELRNPENTWFRAPTPHRPAGGDYTETVFDFKGAMALPSGLTAVAVGTTTPTPSFDANGLSVTVDGTEVTKGEYYLFEDNGFDPLLTEYVDIYVEDWITTSDNAYRVPYIGFATSKAVRSSMTDAVFVGNGEGTANTLAYQLVDGGSEPIVAHVSDYYWGIGYGTATGGLAASKKNIGLRLFPLAGRAYVLGEGGVELEELRTSNGNYMDAFDTSQTWYPFVGFRGIDTEAATERIGSITVRVFERGHVSGDATLGTVGTDQTASNGATPSFASLAIDDAAEDRVVAFFVSGRCTNAVTGLSATFTPDAGSPIALAQITLHQSAFSGDGTNTLFMGLFVATIPTATAGTLSVTGTSSGTFARWGVKAVPMYGVSSATPTSHDSGEIPRTSGGIALEITKTAGGITACAVVHATSGSTLHSHAAEESRFDVDSGDVHVEEYSSGAEVSVLGVKGVPSATSIEAAGSPGLVAVVASWDKNA